MRITAVKVCECGSSHLYTNWWEFRVWIEANTELRTTRDGSFNIENGRWRQLFRDFVVDFERFLEEEEEEDESSEEEEELNDSKDTNEDPLEEESIEFSD